MIFHRDEFPSTVNVLYTLMSRHRKYHLLASCLFSLFHESYLAVQSHTEVLFWRSPLCRVFRSQRSNISLDVHRYSQALEFRGFILSHAKASARYRDAKRTEWIEWLNILRWNVPRTSRMFLFFLSYKCRNPSLRSQFVGILMKEWLFILG